jgi:hypothetical protein
MSADTLQETGELVALALLVAQAVGRGVIAVSERLTSYAVVMPGRVEAADGSRLRPQGSPPWFTPT